MKHSADIKADILRIELLIRRRLASALNAPTEIARLVAEARAARQVQFDQPPLIH